ncbi:MAG: glycoside hydrolase family 5 protein [Chitinispirillaceae bacterium]|nr:glycoside hydrolase family 5 protein [Chitinispirillaceae bacterium]
MSAKRSENFPREKGPFFRTALIGIACVFFISWGGAQQSFVARHGRLSVRGTSIVDKNGSPVTLRGMSLYWSQWQPAFYNASCIKWLRDDWKCTIVRAAMAVQSGGYLSNPSAEVAKVKTVVQACIDLGIYVLIDYHETANGMDNLSKAQTFFREMAQTYGAYPNVIYELWNEPLDSHPWATVIKPYHEAVIPVIRAIDTANIIVCATRSWDQEVDEASLNPLDTSRFKNIAYAIHFYAATHKQKYRDKAQTALDNGIALFATEYGTTQATGPETMDTAETRLWYEFLDKNGIGSCNWSVSAIQEACAILPPNPPAGYANGGWAESVLKPSGKFVRSYLRSADTATTLTFVPENQGPRGESSVMDCFGSEGGLLRVYDLSGACIARWYHGEAPFFRNPARDGCSKVSNGCYVMEMWEESRSRSVCTGILRR